MLEWFRPSLSHWPSCALSHGLDARLPCPFRTCSQNMISVLTLSVSWVSPRALRLLTSNFVRQAISMHMKPCAITRKQAQAHVVRWCGGLGARQSRVERLQAQAHGGHGAVGADGAVLASAASVRGRASAPHHPDLQEPLPLHLCLRRLPQKPKTTLMLPLA